MATRDEQRVRYALTEKGMAATDHVVRRGVNASHWGSRPTSHWSPAGALHTGPVETCPTCSPRRSRMSETTTARIDDLVARYLELEQRKASLVEEQDVIKNQLREALDYGKHETGAGTVTLSVNRRFDPTLAREVLTRLNPALIDACSTTNLNAAAAKKILPPAVYEQCMKESKDPKVVIA